MKRLIAASIAAIALSWQPVHAVSGNDLLDLCTGSPANQALCGAYIRGAVDMGNEVFFCPPKGSTIKQVRDMFVKLMQEAPELRHLFPDVILIDMLGAIWPCPKSRDYQQNERSNPRSGRWS